MRKQHQVAHISKYPLLEKQTSFSSNQYKNIFFKPAESLDPNCDIMDLREITALNTSERDV